MGWTGTLLLTASSDGLSAVAVEPISCESLDSPTSSWCSAAFDDDGIFDERDRILRDVVERTGRPAVMALCLDSDFLGICGVSPGGSEWSGVVYADAARECRDEDIQEGSEHVVPDFPEVSAALAGCVRWAHTADLLPDEERLGLILSTADWVQPAEEFWPEFLEALGLSLLPDDRPDAE